MLAENAAEEDLAWLAVIESATALEDESKNFAAQALRACLTATLASTQVTDRAIQMHGALGVSQDTPLAAMWTNQRTLRLADGPDEVQRRLIAREELKNYQ